MATSTIEHVTNCYIIHKSTSSKTSVSINVTYSDRHGMQIFGSNNGHPIYGCVTYETGYYKAAITQMRNGNFTNNELSCTLDGNTLTIDGFANYANISILSEYPIS